MALKIYTSNRMENLLTALADVVSQPFLDPMRTEMIVVQSRGMQRWLAMELAGRFGVWANCDYPFPNDMVWRLFEIILPDIADNSPFLPEVMAWKILRLMPGFLDSKPFAHIRRYLAGDVDGLKHFQLAEKIADTFDQYTLFRPDMLLAWEAGEGQGDDEWQAILWRELAKDGSGRHRGRLKEEYCHRVASTIPPGNGLPERIALFGVSYLPNYHMDILTATATVTEVNLFLLSPTREYWSDIVSRRVMARLAPAERAKRMEGNPILASMGRLGRDFSDTAIEVGDLATLQDDLYEDPGEDTLLHAIQSGILNLSGTGETEKRLVGDHDRSVQIHSCHSPLREIEALHDALLELMNRNRDLEPRHIVVMTPDIEAYAPYVAMVFEGGRNAALKIPFSIADRNLTDEGDVTGAALKLLGLAGSRLSVVRLLDILETTPVSRRFGLNEEELETIRNWLVDTRVRWGMDERDRTRMGLPAYRDNSWRAGLDRLLLGYAMPDEGGRLFNGLLPYDGMEGAAGGTLGKLIDFVDKVTELVGNLGVAHTLEGWRDCFRDMLADFIAVDDDTVRELDMLADVVAGMTALGERSGYGESVEPAVIRSWFASRLGREQKGHGFMTGGVTFCAMLPMRSIPFRVVALIGMSDGAFPRQSRSPGFDLIAGNPRRGDRSLRDEDRYLFLESILSARECLYISYVGQSVRDNSEIPPSVLVSEFLDVMEREFAPADGCSMEKHLVTRHRLQPFSRDYFTEGSSLFSYSEENCAALVEKEKSLSPPSGFMTAPLPEPAGEWRDVTLEQLIRFFRNPARFFLENRLGIRLEDVDAQLDEREPFGIEGLELYSLKNELVEILLRGDDPAEFFHVARARGILPPARHGRVAFAETLEAAGAFVEMLREKIDDAPPLPRLDCDFSLGRFRLSGRLDGIWTGRMINYRCARMKAKDQLRAWLEHLVLNTLRPAGYPLETVLLMTDGAIFFRPVDDAIEILKTLLEFYWQGLSTPLRFFPDSSMEYAHKLEWRLERAVRVWEPGFSKGRGEGEDPAFHLCFGRGEPFDDEFERVSRRVLEPLIRHRV